MFLFSVPFASTLQSAQPPPQPAPQQALVNSVATNTGAVVNNLNKVLESIHELRKGYGGSAEAKYLTPDNIDITVNKNNDKAPEAASVSAASSPTGSIDDIKGRFGKSVDTDISDI